MPEQYLLDRDVPIPLYFQIKETLMRDIHNGVYAMGDQIPTEYALQERYHVSRSTIRQALNELVNEGWLERKQSKGTFVTTPSESKNVFHSFEPFYSLVARSGKTPRTEVIELGIVEANKFLASAMHLEVGEKLVTMFRRRYIDDEPVVTVRNYLPFSICSFILGYDFKQQSLYELLMQNPQTRLKKTKTIISAEKAKTEDVNLLGAKVDWPMLVFNNTSTTMNDTVVDFAFSHYRGDMSNFEFETSPN